MNRSGLGDGARSFVYAHAKEPNRFKLLFSVTVSHTYYTQDSGLCPDFQVVPTQATAKLMATLGLAFKSERAGFSVFYQTEMLNGIFDYLRREEQADPMNRGFWSRLTFLMKVVNPEFVGVTALPLCLTEARANLYGCNLEAHLPDRPVVEEFEGMALLAPGDFMHGDALYELIGNELDLTIPPEAKRVTVSDISGAVVLFWPNTPDEKLLDESAGEKHVIIDLSTLPHDLYTIALEDAKFRPIVIKDRYPFTKLYVPPDGGSMALLDMLFTKPDRKKKGLYPIPPMFGKTNPPADKCGELRYRLSFEARRTYWRYYVVSQVPGRLAGLKIEGPGAQFGEQAKPVKLPDGSRARLFTTDTALPLRQKSAQRFQLTGSRRDPGGQDNAILRLRLPVAPPAPVWPADESAAGTSEMFVYV